MHSCTLRKILSSIKRVYLEKKLCHRHIDDPIHMHFHDNLTDTHHHSAHTHEVSLGNTTPLKNPSHTARSTFGSLAELPLLHSTSYELTLYYEDNTSNLHVSFSSDTVQSSATSIETEDAASILPEESLLLSSGPGSNAQQHPVQQRMLPSDEIP